VALVLEVLVNGEGFTVAGKEAWACFPHMSLLAALLPNPVQRLLRHRFLYERGAYG
jgi:hypothetical protein